MSLHRKYIQKVEKETVEKTNYSDTCQKTHRDGADVTWRVKSFQTRAAATGKLGRRQSTTVHDGRSVVMMTLSKDDLEPRGPRTGGTRQRGMVALSRANL